MERKKKEKIMHIPDEIVFSILGRLPPKSLVRFKCIWKSWESFVNQYKYHNQKLIVLTDTSIQSIDFEADEIEAVDLHIPFKGTHRMLAIASCNGLLCISIESEGLVATAKTPAAISVATSNTGHSCALHPLFSTYFYKYLVNVLIVILKFYNYMFGNFR
ncbi:hypothetical protein ACOSQ3_007687 [Xanthoceras sorbifolium]